MVLGRPAALGGADSGRGGGEIPSAAVQLALTAKLQKKKKNHFFSFFFFFLSSKRRFQDPQFDRRHDRGAFFFQNTRLLTHKLFFRDKA